MSQITVCGNCGEPVETKTVCDREWDNCEAVTWCYNCEANVEGNTMTEEEWQDNDCNGCGLPNHACNCDETNAKLQEMKDGSAVFV